MSKWKRAMVEVARGSSLNRVAALAGCSKRDAARAAKAVRSSGATEEQLAQMSEGEVAERWFPRKQRERDARYLQPDLGALIDRKLKNPKVPVKLMWYEHQAAAEGAGLQAYSYQAFCEMFADEAKSRGATRRFAHEPGQKAYIDWVGDRAWVTDRVTGSRAPVHVFVACLPYSAYMFARGYADERMASWLDGHARAFREFGGVPHMLVPDNCATATDRTGDSRATKINDTYRRFAEHYGTAVVPARVRRPKDKSLAEGTVNIVERWVVAPALERVFYTLSEFNDFCEEQLAWLNSREMADLGRSRADMLAEERESLLPLPGEPFELCEWRRAKVAPDYHVRVDYMHYSVPYALVGKEVDVALTDTEVRVADGGEVVARHPRLRGRRNQYSTDPAHMPPNHRDAASPWSRERFESWAGRVGPSTGECVGRILASRAVVEQSFVPCRNVLGLSKTYGPAALEAACAAFVRLNPGGGAPSYTALRNMIRAARSSAGQSTGAAGQDAAPKDRVAHGVGRTNGADAYRRRGGDAAC